MRKFLAFSAVLVFPLLLLGAGCSTPEASTSAAVTKPVSRYQHFVSIKYREDEVDTANPAFEELNRDDSSFIGAGWYDPSEEYMILDLNGTYYQYCNLPEEVWEEFKYADSLGKYYNASIKGDYSCQGISVPEYPES